MEKEDGGRRGVGVGVEGTSQQRTSQLSVGGLCSAYRIVNRGCVAYINPSSTPPLSRLTPAAPHHSPIAAEAPASPPASQPPPPPPAAGGGPLGAVVGVGRGAAAGPAPGGLSGRWRHCGALSWPLQPCGWVGWGWWQVCEKMWEKAKRRNIAGGVCVLEGRKAWCKGGGG